MWIWILLGIVLIILVILVIGSRRIDVTHQIGPAEGIEDVETTKAYDRISQWPQFRLLRKMIIRELRRHHPQGILADIGCGPGYLIVDVVRSFPKLSIIGMDISEEMTQKAEKNLSALGFGEGVVFRKGDIHDLPFESNSIDFIISTLSLHHWSEPIKAIREIHRVLKREGQFLLFDLRRDSPRLFYWLMRFAQTFILPSAMRRMNEPTSSVLASYTFPELKQMLAATQFKQWNVKKGIFWSFISGRKN
ncbi:class I SAM-dependent methyltransferase [Chloroflexota bacterium]